MESAYASEKDIISLIEQPFNFDLADPADLTPLDLAFVGDAVGTLIIRTIATADGARPVEKLHRFSARYVSAAAQSEMMRAMQPHLTEEEHKIYKRGRNQKPVTHAKNQSISDYRRATGFEALIGYLYLARRYERLVKLVQIGYAALSEQDDKA